MLKVADLFCGAGGISEGLRMAGFEIVFGLDKDKSAVETFSNWNSPDRLGFGSFIPPNSSSK